MLLPAATLPVNAEQFQGLLGAREAFAVPGCTWKKVKKLYTLCGDQVGRPARCLTQIIVLSDLFTCETGMSKIGTEMQRRTYVHLF